MEENYKKLWNENMEIIKDVKNLIKDCVDAGYIDAAVKYCNIILELRAISGVIISKRYNR